LQASEPQRAKDERFPQRENPGGGSPGFSETDDQHGGIRSPRITDSTEARSSRFAVLILFTRLRRARGGGP
jgi:hypothetical protein